jgi:hypothetical protein
MTAITYHGRVGDANDALRGELAVNRDFPVQFRGAVPPASTSAPHT